MDQHRRRRHPFDRHLGRGRRGGPAGPGSPAERVTDDPLRFEVFCGCLRFGASLDRSLLEGLQELYRRFALQADAESRTGLLLQVVGAVEDGIGSVTALLPFLMFERDPALIRTAALETALLTPLTDGDPMTGPRHLYETAIDAPDEITRAGILGGLLLLGDRRVVEMMDEAWRVLSPEARPLLLEAWSGYAFASTIEFHLDWLPEAVPANAVRIVDAVASIPLLAAHPRVLDLERRFPVFEAGDEETFRVVGEWTFHEYGEVMAPRVIGHQRPDVPSDRYSALLSAWGISG